MGNAVLWLSMIWIPILMYVMLRNETKFKKNIAVGVTLPFAGRSHPHVVARLEQFKKQELLVCTGLIAIGIPPMFLESAASFTLFMVWIVACVVVPYIPYVLCNRDLKRIKRENGWLQPTAVETVTVDLSALPDERWLSPWVFIPAAVLSLLPLLINRDFSPMYVINTVVIALCWMGYRYLFRNKAERVDDNTSVTAALTRIRRCQWGKMWLLCAYSMAVLCWLAVFTAYSPIAMSIGLVVFMAALIGMSMHIEFRTRHLQEALTADSGKSFYVDDDDKWLGGIVYYNPNDDRLIINDRVGTNSSLNLAKPAGKVLYGLLAVILLGLPLLGTLFGGGEITTDISVDSVEIKGSMYSYTIDANDVLDVTLLEELPVISRTAGTGMPTFLGGTFSSRDYGKLKVCLDPTAPPFVLVETEKQTYLLGTRDTNHTRAIYNALR